MTPIIGTIGKGLLANALGDLYLFIKSSSYNTHLEEVLEQLDIKAELDVVSALLDDIESRPECRAVKVASDKVREAVNYIHKQLREIQEELETHKTRYFYSWRSPDYTRQIKNLQKGGILLQKRRELLFSVLGVGQIRLPVRRQQSPLRMFAVNN